MFLNYILIEQLINCSGSKGRSPVVRLGTSSSASYEQLVIYKINSKYNITDWPITVSLKTEA